MPSAPEKDAVRDYWDAESCGERYAVGPDLAGRMRTLRDARYELEPYIPDFADFPSGRGVDVLEIGVGMGTDHVEWARSGPRTLAGIDLTPRAAEFTRLHLQTVGFESDVRVADAEALPFPDESFDIVYSWGVLHHSPDTGRAFAEAHRVLRPGGVARIMIYHAHSLTGYMLWARYALARGRIARSLSQVYADHLESPGTKAYSRRQARALCRGFSSTAVRIQLNHGDLLLGDVGFRHRGALLSTAKRLWPRALIRKVGRNLGLYLLIEARR